jgi:hypothetical protein
MKINREQVFKEYMDWVNKVSDDLEDKTYFSPKEIVEKICEIIEKEKSPTENDICRRANKIKQELDEDNQDFCRASYLMGALDIKNGDIPIK